MGLLSTLLQWNNLDPPSPSEVLRNSRVCSLYQGNRNPFVDHPEYVSSIWGSPDVMPGENITTGSTSAFEPEKEKQFPKAWINEIHYSNEGQDQDEVICSLSNLALCMKLERALLIAKPCGYVNITIILQFQCLCAVH